MVQFLQRLNLWGGHNSGQNTPTRLKVTKVDFFLDDSSAKVEFEETGLNGEQGGELGQFSLLHLLG